MTLTPEANNGQQDSESLAAFSLRQMGQKIADLERQLAAVTAERDALQESNRQESAAMALLLERAEVDAERWRWWIERYPVTTITTFFGNGCVNKTVEMAIAEIDVARK